MHTHAHRGMRRRSFVAMGVALTLAARLRHATTIASSLPSNPALAASGARYLKNHPAERDATLLRRMLFGTRHAPSHAVMRRLVSARAAHDFRNTDVVVVDGWVVARSEARFWALVHLETDAC